MSASTSELGRRERNKRDKLERITAAASDLFARHGVDEVTTQQIADRADIGTGTLFLYARTKAELLLLVQNAHYRTALQRGRADAEAASSTLDALISLLTPVVECNRVHVDNGRTYLREMLFGDPAEEHHAQALSIAAETEQAVADILVHRAGLDAPEAAVSAHVVTAIAFLAMASSADPGVAVADVVDTVRAQLLVVLPR